MTRITPPASEGLSPYVWWAFHTLGLFSNADYAQFVILRAGRVIHRSGVYPRYLRFPFMASQDLQIGDTWTRPDHRGRGWAKFAIREIVRLLARPDRRFWYITEKNNEPSIRAVTSAGFTHVADGSRVSRFGIRALGAFVMERPVEQR